MNDSTALVPLAETMQLGQVLAQSGFFADTAQAAQAVVKVLAGRELGVGPIASMTGIYIVKGKPSIGANLIAGVIKRSGRYNYRIRKHDATICEIEFFERNGDKWESVGLSSFTIDDARKAGTQNLDKYARNMLFARAMSNGARWYTPDVFGGAPVYTPEEMGVPVNEDGDVIDAQYTVTPTTPAVPPSPQAQPTNGGAHEAGHWIDDPTKRKAFWAKVSELGLSEAEVHSVLGDSVRDFKGTGQQAIERLKALAAEKKKALVGNHYDVNVDSHYEVIDN